MLLLLEKFLVSGQSSNDLLTIFSLIKLELRRHGRPNLVLGWNRALETSPETYQQNCQKVGKKILMVLINIDRFKRCGPLGGVYVKPTWETTYRREFRIYETRKTRLVIYGNINNKALYHFTQNCATRKAETLRASET